MSGALKLPSQSQGETSGPWSAGHTLNGPADRYHAALPCSDGR